VLVAVKVVVSDVDVTVMLVAVDVRVVLVDENVIVEDVIDVVLLVQDGATPTIISPSL